MIISNTELAPYRAEFPHLANQRYYLDNASFGVLSSKSVAAIARHTQNRNTGLIATYPEDIAIIEETRQKIAKLINAPSPDNIAFITNTSEGLSLIASGLKWNHGDKVLLNKAEFPANVYPWLNARKHGAEPYFLEAPNGYASAEQIEAEIRPGTRIVAVSAVQFLSGYRIDLHQTGKVAARNNAMLIVDGIQALGNAPIDVQAMQIDGLVTGGHKWLMTTMGAGFAYLSDRLMNAINQQYAGWISVEEPWQLSNFDQNLNKTARRYELGSWQVPGIYGLHASLDQFIELGTDRINRHLVAITDQIDHLMKPQGLQKLTVEAAENRTGIISYHLPENFENEAFLNEMQVNNVNIAIRQNKLRISPHYYVTPEEIIGAMAVFSEVYPKYLRSK